MSGRVRWRRDGETVTGYRKTDRRQAKAVPSEYRLTYLLPAALAFSTREGPTGFAGVTVLPGGMVESRGRNRDWVLQQGSQFLGQIGGGMTITVQATLERQPDPPLTSGAPAHGGSSTSREMIYVPGASVVFLHPLKRALVFQVAR